MPGDSESRDGDDGPFPWQGAPGYSPFDPDRFPPHAPMPGAPPYPAGTEPERGPVADREPGRPSVRSVLPRCAIAAVVWVVIAVVVALAVGVPSWGLRTVALVLPWALTAGVLVLPARRGVGTLVLVALAFGPFWVLHALAVGLLGW